MFKPLKSLFLLIFLTNLVTCHDFGKRIVKTPTQLVNGEGEGTTFAKKGDWPWLTSLFARRKNASDSFFCGATLISELTLLSGKLQL